MAGKFEIKKNSDGQFMFNLRAENAEIILTSELYVNKAGALTGIESVRQNVGDAANFERRSSDMAQPYFVLKAANGEIIGTSEMYSSRAAMETGLASVQANATTAVVVDLTA